MIVARERRERSLISEMSAQELVQEYARFERHDRRRNRADIGLLLIAAAALAGFQFHFALPFGALASGIVIVTLVAAVYLALHGAAQALPPNADFLSLGPSIARSLRASTSFAPSFSGCGPRPCCSLCMRARPAPARCNPCRWCMQPWRLSFSVSWSPPPTASATGMCRKRPACSAGCASDERSRPSANHFANLGQDKPAASAGQGKRMPSDIVAGIFVKRYRRGAERIEVLHHLDLDVAAGEFLALMGPSGSGKTTLLNLIGGLDRPMTARSASRGRPSAACHPARWPMAGPAYRLRIPVLQSDADPDRRPQCRTAFAADVLVTGGSPPPGLGCARPCRP